MVKSHPLVRLPPLELVIPKSPEWSRRFQLSESIRPPLTEQPRECFTAGRLHQSVLIQRSSWVNILRCWHHIVIAGQNYRQTRFHEFICMCDQAFEPG